MNARLIPAMLVLAAASTACASTGRYAPRPFPTAPAGPVATALPGSPALPPGERSTLTADVISTALALRGVPYRLGGSDTNGFDCSGFVQYVLARHAVPMPRTVVEQFNVGEPARAIAPGDLVFFETIGSKASHVGIAVDAASFVHAPNSRGVVRIDRLDAGYWSDRFLGAKRIF